MLSLKIGEEAGMNGFALTAAIVQSVVWPLALIIIVSLMRDRLHDILSRLVEFSFPGGSVKFGEKLAEIKETAVEVVATQPNGSEEPAALGNAEAQTLSLSRLDQLLSPVAIVLESFSRVDSSISEVAAEIGITTRKRPHFLIIEELFRRNIISETLHKLFADLRTLRNDVAHSKDIGVSLVQAIDYERQCEIFVQTLKSSIDIYKRRPEETPKL